MPGVKAANPIVDVPESEYYPGLSQFDIPSTPIIVDYEDKTEGILLKIQYDRNKTHMVEIFQNVKKDDIVKISEWEKIIETKVSNVNPICITVERPNHRFQHFFTARCVTEHGIYSPYSRPVGFDRPEP